MSISANVNQTINHALNHILNNPNLAMNVAKSDKLPTIWVGHEQALQNLLAEIAEVKIVALDTEFIRRNTYYPILALIQVNTGKRIYLIDALKLDLTPLWQTLTTCLLMIWHACGEDLGIFYQLSDCPELTNIFDTQIALGFLTSQLNMGYQKAIANELLVEIDKGESRSNWLQRPLSEAQMSYAADDVRYLLPLFATLYRQLNDKGWLQIVIEDCQLYAKEIYDTQYMDDDLLYLTAANFRYNGLQLAFLQSLLIWREELARTINKPRTFIIRKQGIVELTELLPNSLKQLRHNTCLGRYIIEQYGTEIIKLVHDAKQLPASEYPDPITPPYLSKDKTLKIELDGILQNYHESTGIPVEVLSKKRWMQELLQLVGLNVIKNCTDANDTNSTEQIHQLPLGLQGWRLPLVIDHLLPVLYEYQTHIQESMGLILPDVPSDSQY